MFSSQVLGAVGQLERALITEQRSAPPDADIQLPWLQVARQNDIARHMTHPPTSRLLSAKKHLPKPAHPCYARPSD